MPQAYRQAKYKAQLLSCHSSIFKAVQQAVCLSQHLQNKMTAPYTLRYVRISEITSKTESLHGPLLTQNAVIHCGGGMLMTTSLIFSLSGCML